MLIPMRIENARSHSGPCTRCGVLSQSPLRWTVSGYQTVEVWRAPAAGPAQSGQLGPNFNLNRADVISHHIPISEVMEGTRWVRGPLPANADAIANSPVPLRFAGPKMEIRTSGGPQTGAPLV